MKKITLRGLLLLGAVLLVGLFYKDSTSQGDEGVMRTQSAFDCTTVTDVPVHECEALVALYNATDGDNWDDNEGWLESTTIGNRNRAGVYAVGGNVGRLELSNNNLVGTIPEQVGNLSEMWIFRLQDNDLSGAIPESIGNLSNLEMLNFSKNKLIGPIPDTVGAMDTLEVLRLQENSIIGNIPESIADMDGIEMVWIYDNELCGIVPALSSDVSYKYENNNLTVPSSDPTFDTQTPENCEDISGGPYCGNGILEEGEECDDSNTTDGDGCSSECMIEVDIECETDSDCEGGTCEETEEGECVSGAYGEKLSCAGFTTQEQCLGFTQNVGDNGELVSVCAWNAVSICIDDPEVPYCGDGIVQNDEECDLGEANGQIGELCTEDCFEVIILDDDDCDNDGLVDSLDPDDDNDGIIDEIDENTDCGTGNDTGGGSADGGGVDTGGGTTGVVGSTDGGTKGISGSTTGKTVKGSTTKGSQGDSSGSELAGGRR